MAYEATTGRPTDVQRIRGHICLIGVRYVIRLERLPNQGERRSIIEALKKFPSDLRRNPLGLLFRYGFCDDPAALILECPGRYISPRHEMLTSKALRVDPKRAMTIDRDSLETVTIEQMSACLTALLGNCFIEPTNEKPGMSFQPSEANTFANIRVMTPLGLTKDKITGHHPPPKSSAYRSGQDKKKKDNGIVRLKPRPKE